MSPFTKRPRESVAAWGEERLIAAIRRWLGPVSPPAPFGIGDDCAVLPRLQRRPLVTVDPVIYGRHFDATVRPADVGAKLLKRNLSDIAAMGGRPVAAVVALTLDRTVRQDWVAGFYRGLARCARQFHVPVVGGDVAQADGIVSAALTLIGEAAGPRVLTRTGARIGDAIYVTGQLGGSLASGHHLRFMPRLAEGAWLARQRGVRALMDVSDGLAKDLPALTPDGAVAAVDPTALPRRRGCDVRSALTDGEDYELVFALDGRADAAAFAAAWRRKFRTPLTRIGDFVRAGQRPVTAVRLEDFHGYEHLRP